MTRTIAAALAGLLLSAVSAPALAEPFDRFVELCVATDSQRNEAVAAATGAGWTAVPPEVAAQLGGAGVQDPKVLLSFDPNVGPGAEPQMLVTGWGRGAEMLDTTAVDSETCMVLSMGADAEALRARLQAMLGFASATELEGDAVWLASRDGTGFRNEAALVGADDAVIASAVRDRKIFFAFLIDEEPSMPGLIFGVLLPK